MVELTAGQQVSGQELIALCKTRLGSVMAPKSVDFVASLPRTPVGKLLKSAGADIVGFVRFEVGEGIQVEVTDFAAEVAAQVQASR